MLPSEKNNVKNHVIITKGNKIINNEDADIDQCNEQQLILNDNYKKMNSNELLEIRNNKGVFHQVNLFIIKDLFITKLLCTTEHTCCKKS